MNRVLMVVYNWPPRGGVGMMRALKFAKYLPQFGWEPIIITPESADSQIECDESYGDLPGVRIIKTRYPYSWGYKKHGVIARLAEKARTFLSIPDEHISWFRYAVAEGVKCYESEKYNLIFSTSPPETAHVIARELKKKTGIPWAADLRDPWTEYHHKKDPPLRRIRQAALEKRTIKDADTIITISPTLAKFMETKYGRQVNVITNGFDETDMHKLRTGAAGANKKFTITYAGKIHKDYQNPSIFFASIKELLSEGVIEKNELEINFNTYGRYKPDFEKIRAEYGLQGILNIYPPVSYENSLKKIYDSDAVLAFDWFGKRGFAGGVMPVKIFDYMGCGRPIVFITDKSDSDMSRVISHTRSGFLCRNKNEIKKAVTDLFLQFRKDGRVALNQDEAIIQNFTRRNLASNLAEVFYNVCKIHS